MRHLAPLLLVGTSLLLASQTPRAEDAPAVTPYRPTLSNPAELSAPGWLELEAGLARTRAPDEKILALPYTLKLALSEDWGLMLGGDAYLRSTSSQGASQSGQGDTAFTLKRHFALPAYPELALGMELGVKSPTARKTLGSGRTDWTANGIMSLDLSDTWRLDSNLGMTWLGRHETDTGNRAKLFSASLSKSLADWTLALEWATTHQRGTADERQWLAAASYALTPRLVFDLGAARARQGVSRENTVFFGVTWLAGQVF